jgi:16S rRNA (guanine527-N7)-methyltransferase
VSPSGPPALAARLGIDVPSAGRLARYLDLLAAWSARVNLTAARTDEARIELLLRPAVSVSALVRPGRLLDIGSGNGSPGLVLAALRPDVRVTLLEPRQRRWAFLREAARVMGIEAEVRRERHDQYRGPAADTVTVRGLRLPAAELAPLVAPGGTLLVLGAPLEPHPGLVPMPATPGVHAYRLPGASPADQAPRKPRP